jgi:sulfoxide reductase catalytic subunit YedY
MLILRPHDIRPSEITDEALFWNRRRFLAPLPRVLPRSLRTGGEGTGRTTRAHPLADITSYNNFYEFGLDKADPSRNAHTLRTRPWTVAVEGEVHRPQTIAIDDILTRYSAEERVYRLRCVEGWSMVIPWMGFELNRLLQDVEPTSHAKFVAFTTLHDPAQMPGQKSGVLDWPYVEGLRLDEARHPLTILASGSTASRSNRTARRCGSWCRGSTASRASSRSSGSGSPASNRRRPGTSRRRTSTGSTPT